MNNHTEVLQFGVAGAITPNATSYLYPGNGATTTNEPAIRIPRTGNPGYLGYNLGLKNLFVYQRVASGVAGRTDIYTVRVNGVDTAITCTLDNAQTGQDTTNTAAVAAGDRISVKLVSNDAADTSADVAVSLEVEFAQ